MPYLQLSCLHWESGCLEDRSGLPGSGNHWAEIKLDVHLPCPTPNPQGPFSLPCNSSPENGWWYLHAKLTRHPRGLIQKIRWRRNSLSCYHSTYIISSTLSLGLKSLLLQYLLFTSSQSSDVGVNPLESTHPQQSCADNEGLFFWGSYCPMPQSKFNYLGRELFFSSYVCLGFTFSPFLSAKEYILPRLGKNEDSLK